MDFSIFRGDTVFLNGVVTQNNAVYDLTGCKMFFTAKIDPSLDDNHASVAVSSPTLISILAPTTGSANILIPSTLTSGLPITQLYYDVQIVDASGNVFTAQSGLMDIINDVTNRTS